MSENEIMEIEDITIDGQGLPPNINGWSVFAELPDNLKYTVFWTSCILSGIGILLNATALVIVCDLQLIKKKQFMLIRSLTIVDLLSCLTAVVYAVPRVQSIVVPSGGLGDFLCTVVFSRFLFYTLSAVSAWHLVAISFERYLSIIHTEWYDLHFTGLFNVTLIVISWVIGVYTMNYNFYAYKQTNGTCVLEWSGGHPTREYAGVNEFLFMAVFPVLLMGFFYYSVYKRYKEFSAFYAHAPIDVTNGNKDIKNPQSVRLTLLVLLCVYLLSWCPNEFLWLFYGVGALGVDENDFRETHYFITQLLVSLNAVCNPILYASSYSEFRYLFRIKVSQVYTPVLVLFNCRRCVNKQKVHTTSHWNSSAKKQITIPTLNRATPELQDFYDSETLSDLGSFQERETDISTAPSF